MRRWLFWSGIAILLVVIPIAFLIEAYQIQDIPPLRIWKLAVAAAAFLLVVFARNRDDVLKHHLE